jgi:carboxymethylenebutenolidase
MPRIEVVVPTPDGEGPATLHVPGAGRGPAVIVYPDAAGVRETFRVMADRLAGVGYVALLPDVYHRDGAWRPFDAATVFSDPPERERLMAMGRSVTATMTDRDAGAFLDFLAARPEVAGERVGTVGYCMGGYLMEDYPAAHGFAVPDNPTYDPAADERNREALDALLAANLPGYQEGSTAAPSDESRSRAGRPREDR